MLDITYKYFSTNIFVSDYEGIVLFYFGFSHAENYFYLIFFFYCFFILSQLLKCFSIPKT